MHKIGDDTPTADGNDEFKETPTPTDVRGAWLNTMQRELITLAQFNGQPLSPSDDGQILKGVLAMLSYMAHLNWRQQTGSFGSSNIKGVAHDKSSQFVAVGGTDPNGKIANSPDGKEWTEQENALENLEAVAHNGSDLWCVVGWTTSGKIYTSADGETWALQSHPFGANRFYCVAHDQSGLWVAAGGNGNLLATSPDGVNWTIRITNLTVFSTGVYIRAVAHNGSDLWCAATDNGEIANSANGTTGWALAGTVPFGSTAIYALAHNKRDIWVAAGASGKIATSPDGDIWTLRNDHPFGTDDIRGLVCTDTYNGLFIAVGASGKIAVSPDGVTWESADSSFANTEDILAVAHGLRRSVAVGDDNKIGTSLTL